MQMNGRRSAPVVIAFVAAVAFLIPANLAAQAHVISPAELRQQVMTASQNRQQNIDTLQHFLATPVGQKAMQSAHTDPQQVKTAVSTLDDQDLARLAARADKAQADFAAGRIGDRDLLLIAVAILVIVLIIVAVR